MTRHRSPIAVLATLGRGCSRSRRAVRAAASPPPSAPPPGPPFPAPEIDRAVYDYAGILSPEAIAARRGDDRRDRGADRRRGRRLHPGQRRLSHDRGDRGEGAGPDGPVGHRSQGLQRRAGHLLRHAAEPRARPGPAVRRPGLRGGVPVERGAPVDLRERHAALTSRPADFDAALAAALEKVDAAATPSTPTPSSAARQINAVVGLVGAPIVFLGLAGWAFFNWRRFGKDPVYLDDPSVLMPAPPPDLTAASGRDDHGRRDVPPGADDGHARPRLARPDRVPRRAGRAVRRRTRSGSTSRRPPGDAVDRGAAPAQPATPDRTRRGGRARTRCAQPSADTGSSSPDDLPKFGAHVARFRHGARGPRRRPGLVRGTPEQGRLALGRPRARWRSSRASSLVIAGLNIPFSGLTLHRRGRDRGRHRDRSSSPGSMPAVTMPGAMIRAMLAAYRRTLQKTMAQARSMQQVVDEAGLDWLDTPDQAVVWGTALGLQGEIEGVLSAQPRGRQGRARTSGVVPVLPGLVPDLERHAVRGLGAARRQRRQPVLGLGHPGRRRDDVGARDDRQLARRRRAAVVAGSAAAGPAVAAAEPAAGSRRRAPGLSGPEHVAARVQTLDRERRPGPRPPLLVRHPEVLRRPGDAVGRQAAIPVLGVAEGARHRHSRPCCRGTPTSPRRAPRARRRRSRAPPRASPCRTHGPGTARPSHDPVATVRWIAKSSASTVWEPIGCARPGRP